MITFSSLDVIERLLQIYSVRTMKELSQELGFSAGVVANWNSRNSIPLDVLLSVSKQKDVSLDWLVFGKEKEPQLDTSQRMLLTAFDDLDDEQKMQAVVFVGSLAKAGNVPIVEDKKVCGINVDQSNNNGGINTSVSGDLVIQK